MRTPASFVRSSACHHSGVATPGTRPAFFRAAASSRGSSKRQTSCLVSGSSSGGVSRLENGTRVADVPELLALAVALDVTPNRLLLTADATDEPVGLTPNLSVTARCAWKWAAGDQALPKNGVHRYGSGFQLVNGHTTRPTGRQ